MQKKKPLFISLFLCPVSMFSSSFICQLMVIIEANLAICFTNLQRSKFSFQNRINKNCIATREHCAPKIIFGPGKLSGVSRFRMYLQRFQNIQLVKNSEASYFQQVLWLDSCSISLIDKRVNKSIPCSLEADIKRISVPFTIRARQKSLLFTLNHPYTHCVTVYAILSRFCQQIWLAGIEIGR